jgi:RimJ/RimL family protein N-acetyltransferase
MLVDELVAWARVDLLAAYEVLCLVLYWSEHTAVRCVRDDSSALQAVAVRWDPAATRYPGRVSLHYAARNGEALERTCKLMPPENGCLVIAPNTEVHQRLLSLQPATRHPDEFFYMFTGAQPPDVRETVVQISAADAPSVGLRETWDWPSILGEPATERPIHCIVRDGRAIAVAAVSYPNALTEEVGGVWVEESWRRQGLGWAVVASATADILTRRPAAVYETGADNAASQRLAESVGYRRLGSILRIEYGGAQGPEATRGEETRRERGGCERLDEHLTGGTRSPATPPPAGAGHRRPCGRGVGWYRTRVSAPSSAAPHSTAGPPVCRPRSDPLAVPLAGSLQSLGPTHVSSVQRPGTAHRA